MEKKKTLHLRFFPHFVSVLHSASDLRAHAVVFIQRNAFLIHTPIENKQRAVALFLIDWITCEKCVWFLCCGAVSVFYCFCASLFPSLRSWSLRAACAVAFVAVSVHVRAENKNFLLPTGSEIIVIPSNLLRTYLIRMLHIEALQEQSDCLAFICTTKINDFCSLPPESN